MFDSRASSEPPRSGFFGLLSRFNAIVSALFMLAMLAGLLFVVFQLVLEWRRPRVRTDIVHVNPDEEVSERYELGMMESIEGSASVRLPLYSTQEYAYGYAGSKSSQSVRNLLLFDLLQGRLHWLLPDNQALIYRHHSLQPEGPGSKPVRAFLYELIERDSNQDQRLTGEDRRTLAFSTPEGEKFHRLLEEVDSLVGVSLIDSQQAVLVWNRDGKAQITWLSVTDGQILRESPVPEVGP